MPLIRLSVLLLAEWYLEVPVEVGNQVIESNNFNEGTTIAAIADVEKMIFEGKG